MNKNRKECLLRGVSFEIINPNDTIIMSIADPQNNYDIVKLEKSENSSLPPKKQPWRCCN